MTKVSAIAAIGRNRELGKDNKLIWKIPDDLKRLRMLTIGHPVIMGRKTFDSIIEYNGKPLPERPNVVITRHPEMMEIRSPSWDNVVVASSVDEALEEANKLDVNEVFIIGGAQIFEAALPRTDKLYLTIVDAEDPAADTFFPAYENRFIKNTFEESREWRGIKYRWVDLERA